MTNRFRRIFKQSLLSCIAFWTVVSASTATRLDLSFLHRINSSTLADVIRNTLETTTNLDIDVSSSLIGKDVKDILTVLKEKAKKEALSLDLKARSNSWSQKEATLLFKTLSASDDSKENQETQDSNSEFDAVASTTDADDKTGRFSLLGLDLGWNDFSQASRENKDFLKSLQNLIQETRTTPECFVLRLDVCNLNPAACRAIGKGIIARYENEQSKIDGVKPLVLHLTRNEHVGDAGAAALAAAIRSVVTTNNGTKVFDVLNLAGCGIGDTGAEALAIVLEKHPLCIRHLDLSNNKISDEGAAALGHALSSGKLGQIETLDLSNNKDIGDSGARALAATLENGTVQNMILRSCHVRADGASAFAKALKAVGKSTKERPKALKIDLSGNPLGILRKKAKSSGYSATALRSKATATTAAYMSLIGRRVQKGLKEIGLAEAQDTLESDDEEEARMSGEEKGQDTAETICGALAFADAFIDHEDDDADERTTRLAVAESPDEKSLCEIELGLRHCAFDTRAAEALAAVVHEAESTMQLKVRVDVTMNNVLEEEAVTALRGDEEFQDNLVEMAEHHLEAMEALRMAQRRALEAAKAAAARMRAEAEMEVAWGAPVEMGDDYDETWDSDADYDDQEDINDYF